MARAAHERDTLRGAVLDSDALRFAMREERDAARAHLAAVRAMLRIECAAAGCNDWPNDLHLADVVEKHLARKLNADIDAARAAMRRVLVGAENQGAFTGMSWREAADILRAAIEAAA